MKALTVKQPYAWFIVSLGNGKNRKDIENRTWNTKVRGTIAIHAGLKFDNSWHIPDDMKEDMERELVYGAIVGLVDMIDVVEEHDSDWFEGPFGFVLENPRELPSPIPCKGKLGLWDVLPEIEKKISKQLKVK
jgi:hypothetical protein